jgi:heme A synthase
MKKTNEIVMMIATALLCCVLLAERLTGELWHVIFGVIFIILMGKHLCMQMLKKNRQEKAVRIVEDILLGALLTLLATGVLMYPLQGALVIKILHKLAALVFVVAVAAHILQHKKRQDKAEKVQK